MARKPTYGESMAKWERQSDERFWRRSLQDAITSGDESKIEELVREGILEDYSFSFFTDDPIVDRLLGQYLA